MKEKFFKKRTVCVKFLLLALVISVLLSACGCTNFFKKEALSKSELYENVHTDLTERDSVTRHIYEWGFPSFDTNKMLYVESFVSQNYYERMPERLSIATSCADFFLEYFYDVTDLTDSDAVTDALLKCFMASVGDPYAIYRVPEEHESFSDEISGGAAFVGIGIMVRQTEEGMPYISGVYKDSGAEAAGIRERDVILAAGGKTVETDGYQAVIDSLKGEEGSTVEVSILRGGETLAFTVQRRSLTEVSVYYSFNAQTGYGYVNIISFQRSTGDEFRAAIDALEEAGAVGIVFDLRNNLGGLLDAVRDAVSYLTEDGIPFISYNKYNTEKTVVRTGMDSHSVDVPMVVLMNEYTASAAEIFASALRDYRNDPTLGAPGTRVTLVGKNSYGKGVMQKSYLLADGSSVTFTTEYYNPPSGINYHGSGVAPDPGYEVEARFTVDGDAQLDRAYEALDEYFEAAAA